jgi:hypothetical protein
MQVSQTSLVFKLGPHRVRVGSTLVEQTATVRAPQEGARLVTTSRFSNPKSMEELSHTRGFLHVLPRALANHKPADRSRNQAES